MEIVSPRAVDHPDVHPISADANNKKDRTAAERQRRHREKQRERDGATDAVTDDRDNDRDSVTTAPLVPEFELSGGKSKALAH
jgi:hypothetical protein